MKPRIDRTNLKALAVRAGKPIFFDVNVKGEPAPKVQWFQKWKKEEKEVGHLTITRDFVQVDFMLSYCCLAYSMQKWPQIWNH